MKISTSELLDELKNRTKQHLQFAEMLSLKTEHDLNFRTSADSWSTLECLEHLNRYGNFYIPEINRTISSAGKPSQLYLNPEFLEIILLKVCFPKKN